MIQIMARELDIILFGATGYSGKSAIPVLAKLAKSNKQNLTWGIAGRSREKLENVLKDAESKTTGTLSRGTIPIIQASIEDQSSLNSMASRARIIINCCGPYSLFGEPVVKACVEQGAHYVDITGEPLFVDRMEFYYNEKARERGVYVVSCCGFDSVPADLGVAFLQDRFGGTLNSVESYLSLDYEGEQLPGPLFNFGTWESLCGAYTVGNLRQMRALRRKLVGAKMAELEPKITMKLYPHQVDFLPGWIVPFAGPDQLVIQRSQQFIHQHEKKRPIQIQTYLKLPSFLSLLLLLVSSLCVAIFTQLPLTRKLLLKYPSFFSAGLMGAQEPLEEKVNNFHFTTVFVGKGWSRELVDPLEKTATPPDKVVVAKAGGRNPGYGVTSLAVVLAAIVILTESEKMPPGGGVLPPGAAFAKTSLVEKLSENGVTFEIVSVEGVKK